MRVTTLIAFATVLIAGCSKEETKQAPGAPDPAQNTAAAAQQGAPGTVNVQGGGAQVQAGGGQVAVKAPGANVQVGADGKPVVLQNGTNQLKVEANKVEGKTGDGRQAVVQGDTVKLKNAEGQTVEVKGGTVNAGGVKIEGNKVIVPGVGTVENK